jgi:HK97 gp10 family phage protein
MAQVKSVVHFNKLPQCPGLMSKAVDTAFQSLGPKLLSTMQGKTPVDTGELRGSETQTAGGKTLTLRAGTDHAGFVEFGTRKMAAQPYMRPTVEGGAGQVASEITSAVSAAFGSL